MKDDRQLLSHYAEERSESAFAELVNRHVDMVYSAALRVVRGDTHLARDVAQIVFTDLARKAGSLPHDLLLAGWLYRCASFTAVKAVRSERRRREREQTAMQMIAQNQTESDWEQIAPEIDEALNQLNEADRNAIVLRFLKRCDFRAVASALGVSEEAAQKRVSRALEKLRELLRPAPAGAKWSVTALASLLATDAVTAAPAGLANSIVTASLGATAAGVGLTTLKVMGMTKLQIAATAAVVLGVVTTPIAVQQRSLNRMRDENVALRQKAAELAALRETEVVGLQQSVDQRPVTDEERAELLHLRNEVRQLRELVFQARNGTNAPGPRPPPADVASASATNADAIKELGVAASRGDFTALDKLAELVAAARKASTNQNQYVMGHIDPAFTVLATEAGRGNDTALEALWRATRNKQLAGLATRALGEAAGMGNEKALEPLLDPDRYGLLLSGTVSALRPAAEAGNARAITALAAVAADPKSRPLWYLTARGLEKATIAGDALAINAMAVLARSGEPNASREALRALENASFKNHPAASEALRSLGYQ